MGGPGQACTWRMMNGCYSGAAPVLARIDPSIGAIACDVGLKVNII